MPVFSSLKKSGGSLIFLALFQFQATHAAELELPPGGLTAQPISGKAELTPNAEVMASSQAVAALERRYFEHDFHSDPIVERLLRLEQLLFGEGRTGSINTRLQAVQNIATRANDAKQPSSASSAVKENEKSGKTKGSFQDELNAGINDFKAQRYHHAQDEFERAISLNPRSAEAYANLGGSLLMLKDKQGAQDAFKAAYALQPFGKLGAYARNQIIKIARDEAYEKTDPQDSPKTVERTIKTINRQTADRTRMYQAQGARTANYRINLANIEIERLTGETQQALADLRAQRSYTTAGNYGVPHYHRGNDAYDRQDISNMNYIRTNYLRTDGQVQANLALTDGFSRSTSVFDAGTNLKDQILQPVSPGGARLRALGTSLYARYYGDGMPSSNDPLMVDPPPAALQATAKSLSRSTQK